MIEIVEAISALGTAAEQMTNAKELFELIRSDTEQRVAVKEGEVDAYLSSAEGHRILPIPLNLNCAFVGDTDEERLQGWGATGDVSLETVHPYEKGFEGPYTDTASVENAIAPDIASATQQMPFFYGAHNKGPRMGRGGMAGGFQGISTGRVLKITKQAGVADTHDNSVIVTLPQHVKSSDLYMRGFIYTEYEAEVYVGRVNSSTKIPLIKGEWTCIDDSFNATGVFSKLIYLNLRSADYVEVYLALPSFYVEANEGDRMSFITGV